MLYVKLSLSLRRHWYVYGNNFNKSVLVYDSDDLTVQKVKLSKVYEAIKMGVTFANCKLSSEFNCPAMYIDSSKDFDNIETNELLYFNEKDGDYVDTTIIYKDRLVTFKYEHAYYLYINETSNNILRLTHRSITYPRYIAKYEDDFLIVDCGICFLVNVFSGEVYALSNSINGTGLSSNIEIRLNHHRPISRFTPIYMTVRELKRNKILDKDIDILDESRNRMNIRNEGADIAAYFREQYGI